MNLEPPPPNWGADELTKFFNLAVNNSYASYIQYQQALEKIIEIDEIFLASRDAFDDFGEHPLVPGIVLMAHSNYRAAIRIAISGQIPEAYTLLRGVLERGLYALHMVEHPELPDIWLARGENKDSRKRVRNEFSSRNIMDTLAARNARLFETVKELYERTIDEGAHPNPRAFLTNAEYRASSEAHHFEYNYMNFDVNVFKHLPPMNKHE